jgi:uncharacterized protein (TIGR02646 family)
MMPYSRRGAPACLTAIDLSTWPLSKACYLQTKERLFEASGDRCAFCDGLTKITSKATVEHFRPKSKFPALKAQWSNLFPCCDQCQSAKLEKFDEALLKPDELDYRFGKYFVCNFRTGEIEIDPGSEPDEQRRAVATTQIYGLNTTARCNARRTEHRKWLAVVSQIGATAVERPDLDDWQFRFFLQR